MQPPAEAIQSLELLTARYHTAKTHLHPRTSRVYWGMQRRNRYLLRWGERALSEAEAHMARR